MVGFITAEGSSLPASTDNWDVVAAFRTMANSQRTVVPVPDRAAAIVVANGMASDGRTATTVNPLVVYRADTDALETFDGTNWWGAMGYTNDNTAWQTLTLNSPWVNYTGGGGYRPSMACRVVNNMVQINGMVKNGATGTVITTMPAAYRPLYTTQYAGTTNSANTYNWIVVGNDGTITYTGATLPGYLSINVQVPMD